MRRAAALALAWLVLLFAASLVWWRLAPAPADPAGIRLRAARDAVRVELDRLRADGEAIVARRVTAYVEAAGDTAERRRRVAWADANRPYFADEEVDNFIARADLAWREAEARLVAHRPPQPPGFAAALRRVAPVQIALTLLGVAAVAGWRRYT